MDFSLSQDQQMLVDLCEKIAQGFEDSYWQKIDEEYGFPREFWSTLVEQGILGITIPEEYGGSGLGMVEMCLAAEALSSNGGDCGGMFVGGPVFGGCLINSAGTPEQKAQVPARHRQGRAVVRWLHGAELRLQHHHHPHRGAQGRRALSGQGPEDVHLQHQGGQPHRHHVPHLALRPGAAHRGRVPAGR